LVCIVSYEKRAVVPLRDGGESGFNIIFSACIQNSNWLTDGVSRRLHIAQLRSCFWAIWVDEHGNLHRHRDQLSGPPQPLSCHLRGQQVQASDISPGPVQTRDQAEFLSHLR
jgi:hypothetical protein